MADGFVLDQPQQAPAPAFKLDPQAAAPQPAAFKLDPPAEEARPRFDVVGDIKRAAGESYDALKKDLGTAFPSLEEQYKTVKQGWTADLAAQAGRPLAAAKALLDAAGIISSPVTGAARATIGSLMSYLPGMDKKKADDAIDTALMAARPGKGGGLKPPGELVPAVKTAEGVKVGKVGDNHDTVVPAAAEKDRGFVDPAQPGKVLDRAEAAQTTPAADVNKDGKLTSEEINVTAGRPARKEDRIVALETDRAAEARGEKVAGSPARSFSDMVKEPDPISGKPPSWPARIKDNLDLILNPAKRGPAAKATGGAAREAMAVREQRYQQAADELRSFGKTVGALDEGQRYAFIDAVETGKGEALTDPKLRGLASTMRRLFDERWQEMDGLDIAPDYVTDYFPHLWKDPQAAEQVFTKSLTGGSLEGGKAFTRARSVATVAEGRARGLQLKSDNPIEVSLEQLSQMDKFITARKLFEEMKDTGLVQFTAHGRRTEPGFQAIQDKMARTLGGQYYARPEVATIINRMLAPGLSEYPIYEAVRHTGNLMNMAQLGLSGFHALFVTADAMTSQVALGLKQMSRLKPAEAGRSLTSLMKAPAAPLMNYLKGRKVLKQYLGTGSYGREMEEIVDGLLKGGGRVRMDQFYRGTPAGSFWQALRGTVRPSSGRATVAQEVKEMLRTQNPVAATVQILGRLAETTMAPLMEDMVPKMKLGIFFELMKDELRTNPAMDTATKRATAGRLWDSVDNRLGQMVYDNLFWNKALKDIGHIGVRALGWNLGTLRELGGGVRDLAGGRSVKAGSAKQITDRASYVVAMPAATALMGAVYQYLKTGQGPQEIKDYFFPRTGGKGDKGEDERVNMPGYFKDAYEWSVHPEQTATNKINPLWQTLYQMMNNQDFFGGFIVDPQSSAGQKVKDLGSYLASVFTPLSMRAPPANAESKITGPERFFGIRNAPYDVRRPEKAAQFQRRDDQKKRKTLDREKVQGQR